MGRASLYFTYRGQRIPVGPQICCAITLDTHRRSLALSYGYPSAMVSAACAAKNCITRRSFGAHTARMLTTHLYWNCLGSYSNAIMSRIWLTLRSVAVAFHLSLPQCRGMWAVTRVKH